MKTATRSALLSLALLLSLSFAPPVSAQVQFQIQHPTPRPQDSNFKIAGTYGFSVHWENPSSYRLYATSGNQRKTWHQGVLTDLKHIGTDPCPLDQDPSAPGWDQRCQEQVGLYLKYVDCAQGSPCQWQGKWNAYPGTLNASTFPVAWLWPATYPAIGIPGHTPVLTRLHADSPPICGGGVCPPPTGVASSCHPGNPNSYHKGVANGKVVHVWYGGGDRRWFMAYNTTVKTNASGGSDRFRIAWAYSSDGKNWTSHQTFLLRSHREALSSCASRGVLVTDMFIDTGKFYIVFFEIGTNNVYMARSTIAPYGSNPGYGTWQVSGPIVNNKRTWINLPSGGGLVNLAQLGAVSISSPVHGSPIVPLKQTDINRIYVPGRSGPGLVAGVDYQYVMITMDRRETGPPPAPGTVLQVWTADTLDDPFVYQSEIDTSMLTKGAHDWEFGLTQYADNLDTSPRLVADQLDFWVVQNLSSQGPNALVTVSRTTAKVTGGIFP